MRTDLEGRCLAALLGVYEAQQSARIVKMGLPDNGTAMREVRRIIDEYCPAARRVVDLELETAKNGGGV